MTQEQFQELTSNGLIFLDGATGSNLLAAGMPNRVCAEKWILENPEVLKDLQKRYVQAGSQIVYAPTFGANRHTLSGHHLEDRVRELNVSLVQISKEAADGKAFVAGDLSPTGMLLECMGGEDEEEELSAVYQEQIEALLEGGVDLFVIETMMSLDETRVALQAVRSLTDLPVMCSMTVGPKGRTLFGSSIFDAVRELPKEGASAVGINCCSGPDTLEDIVRSIKELATVPVIAKPNAGLPTLDARRKTVYSMEQRSSHST